ncbi:transposase [Streptomyces pharetrae]|uniref:transposase n=1 Tax=Streptomyces pharetrae TaxID=291370 RepID=UPI0033612EDD
MFTRALQQIQAQANAAGDIDWLVQIDSTIVRAHQHAAATGRKRGRHRQDEPDDHALGRSRGGLTTKIHLAFDGKGRPLAILVTPGQHHDSICARPLLERIRVPRPGPGRPRCRPDQVIADKALGNGLGPIGDGLG